MTKKERVTRRSVLASFLALAVCISMLVGTSYAWFTDSVTSSGNVIKSGKLDIEMYWADGKEDPKDTTANWQDASAGAIFKDDVLWEPGFVQVRHINIKNVGNLAFKYKFAIVANGTLDTNANGHTLADAIDVYYVDPAVQIGTRDLLTDAYKLDTLTNVLANIASADSTAQGVLYPAGKEPAGGKSQETVTIALKMREDVGNEYQDMTLGTDFSVQVLATQYTFEQDTFDDQYDKDADETPDNAGWPFSISNVVVNNPAVPATVTAGPATVTIPANSSAANDVYELTVDDAPVDPSLTIEAGNGASTFDVTLKKNGTEVTTSDGSTVYTVELNIGFVDLQKFFHYSTELAKVNDIASLSENKYYYDSTTGILTFMCSSFSPFTAEYRFIGNGTADHPYVISDYQGWKKLSNNSGGSGMANKGYYFLVDTDLDFTDITTGEETLQYFNGHLDFNNHSVKGVNYTNSYCTHGSHRGYACLIKYASDVTISNLNYYVTSPAIDETNKIIGYASENKSIKFDNVTTYGFANLTDNNTGIYVYTCESAASVELDNCTNYANMINSNGFTAIFVGRGNGCKSFVFNNCVNEGNINALPSGQNTGMLISNLNTYRGTVSISVTNCVNRGTIQYTKGAANLIAGNTNLGETLSVSGKVTNEGTVRMVSFTPLNVVDGKFDTSAINGAASYQLGFAFNDASGVHGGTVSIAFNPTQDELTSKAIFAYKWIGASALPEGAVTQTISIGGTTIETYTAEDTTYYVYNHGGYSTSFKTQPVVTLTAIASDGSVSLYTYSYN